MAHQKRVVVVGLGYVGLPLAVTLARSCQTWGLDIDTGRIAELEQGHDRTGEIDRDRLAATEISFTADPEACPSADIYIVTVPTPVDQDNRPDLSILMAATRTVGQMLRTRERDSSPAIVVYESTVYPGVTEDLCGPALEQASGLICGKDFFLGYSPERINPGDKVHTVDKIAKVVSGQTPEVLEEIADLYSNVTSGEIFRAASIKAAEAAKVIENAQRDINIAFINEITQIFDRMDLSVWDVLAAAGTKWNFLKFEPGLVGGHCIGVDPFYLAHRASELGLDPRIILAGRGMNDGMAEWTAKTVHEWAGGTPGRTLVLGLAFKPDVPDLRNSKVADLVTALRALGHQTDVHDPLVSAEEARHEYAIDLVSDPSDSTYDLIVLAVPHREFIEGIGGIVQTLRENGRIADLKNALAKTDLPAGVERWTM
ncbi:nucleotide sugar dehydrogenase [Novosphingopyxis sp. YJ-S2-01]|uniref:nucleotide sugar dehydrogenase n=1 Tax=Novosphingopyxis sp. YJ-S2-01 TaxID=2794021 RepID=UPI0018DBFCD7|nr:nucleotide sugar dehydrogenase [Novosphingopyxis sp. YJ-S2-01]MBH9538427.1 nucleotide sugar dehydrogenase [Novosphingopyxis sp. YJ-S2-01]